LVTQAPDRARARSAGRPVPRRNELGGGL